MKVGDVVIYHDPTGKAHNALLTATWGESDTGTFNLVYVSSDENEQDPYGRQTKRESSVSHKTNNQAWGRYWRKLDEQPNPHVAPTSV
jgi:hypothetical protein